MQKSNEICISETQKMSVWTPRSAGVTLLLYITIIHVYWYICNIPVSLCSYTCMYIVLYIVQYSFCWCTLIFYHSSVTVPHFKILLLHSFIYNATFHCFGVKPINQIYENSLHNLVTIDKTVKTHPFTSWSLIHSFIRSTIPVHQWLCISIKWQFCRLSNVWYKQDYSIKLYPLYFSIQLSCADDQMK